MTPSSMIKKVTRPRCPTCGRELVFSILAIDSVRIFCWLCDCHDQPSNIKQEIVLAREWDERSLFVVLTDADEEDEDAGESSEGLGLIP